MEKRQRDCLLFVGFLCLIALAESATVRIIPVGVILDSSSSLGPTVLNCTNIGLHGLYSSGYSYGTKLQLHFKDSHADLLTAASAAWDLINGTKVHAILGPENYEQASSTRSHCFQFVAIAAIIRAYNWQSVVAIYEDPDFRNDLIPCLTYALQEMDTLVPNAIVIRRRSNDSQITGELDKINPERAHVFLAHMTVELWSRLVKHAKVKWMLSRGHPWILTQGLSSVIDPEAKDMKVKAYMDGALGVRPSVAVRRPLNVSSIIAQRFSLARTLKFEYNKTLSIWHVGLRHYHSILAKAVEKASLGNSTFGYGNESRVDLEDRGMRNETGPKLRRKILAANFVGLENGEPAGKYKLTDPIWPGNTTERPPKLEIGVPKMYFTQFVDVNVSVEGQNVSASSLTVDVFKRVVHVLPFPLPYEFVPVSNGELTPSSYDDLLCHITDKLGYTQEHPRIC
ncbi:glutamate receptor 2.7-like [Neltuma alba]|uniref:glutamate receptor 2.7-like n=1 Tax=Neltuma alba TaxID=207710 RepID=UPI0010A5248C|nr:glutamate receptor 2.7-like [Prosopis alba]